MRAVGYRSELPGFIDSYYPDRAVKQDVNGGTRSGGRLAFRFEPTENISITPRIVYQKLETDGFPRYDFYNILGNVYTTTETQVDPGERGQVTQIQEGLTDDFAMGDLKLEFGFGDVGLTSVTTTSIARYRCVATPASSRAASRWTWAVRRSKPASIRR